MKDDVKKWIEEDGQKFLTEIGINRGQTVLDFGCGEGRYTIPASKVVGKEGKIYALDKDRETLDKLEGIIKESNIKNIELVKEKSRIPLDKDSLDVVLCYDVIHYESKKQRKTIYSEVYRVLKEKGLFSVYPKHHKKDYPLMELANLDLGRIIEEIEEVDFSLKQKILKTLIHDDCYNEGYVLNFRKH